MGHSIMCNLGTTRGLYSVALASPASALPSTSSSEHSPVPFLTSRRVTTKGRSPRLGKDTQCVRYYITQDLLRSPDTAGLGKRRENRLFAVGSYSKPMLRRLPRYCTQCSEFVPEGVTYLSLLLRELTSLFIASAVSVASSSSRWSFLRDALALWASSSASSSCRFSCFKRMFALSA